MRYRDMLDNARLTIVWVDCHLNCKNISGTPRTPSRPDRSQAHSSGPAALWHCYLFLASTAPKMERAELLCALFVDANDDSDLDEDELLLLAVFFSRGSVPRSLPIGRLHCAVCRLADCTARSAMRECSTSGDVHVKGYCCNCSTRRWGATSRGATRLLATLVLTKSFFVETLKFSYQQMNVRWIVRGTTALRKLKRIFVMQNILILERSCLPAPRTCPYCIRASTNVTL